MYINKYSGWRRMLYRAYDALPATRIVKRLSQPLKIRKLRRIVESRKRQLADARAATGRDPLFSHVEIETINRCNGECGFCPVNRRLDPRPAARMDEELFRSIIEQLRDLDYRGAVHFYSNNEPLLDARIFDFVAHARRELPEASLHFCTNGLLLTPDKLRALAGLLDHITVNNYSEDFRLAPHMVRILEIVSGDPVLDRKVAVTMRYRRELMTSRGGQSPNKQDILPETLPVGCLLPARQVIVRPDGKLSLCCNDALGRMTMGDLARQSLAGIWFGDEYSALRRAVLGGRGALDLCRHCDTMHF